MIATAFPDDNGKRSDDVINVDPALAFRWLEGNTHNRPLNQAHVERLARDMKAGRWRLTHQGIAFDTTGLLIDGQHRLCAVIEADTSVRMRVFFNEPPDNRHVLDTGERRSNLHVLSITGQVGKLTTCLLATLRALLAGMTSRPRRLTPGEEAEQFAKHRLAIEFAMDHLGTASSRGLATSQIRAVVARAYYSANHQRLAHFCDVLRSGMPADEADSIIVSLRDFLIQTHGEGKGEAARRVRYAKTEWALAAFLDGRIPKRLCGSDAELFPLPDEIKDVAAVSDAGA